MVSGLISHSCTLLAASRSWGGGVAESFRDPAFGEVHPLKFYDGPRQASESLQEGCQF